MREIDPDLFAHLQTGATMLASCWQLTRTDGMILGFTDHDLDLSFDGVTYHAQSGWSARDARSSLGLSVDHLEVDGALQSGFINEDDLHNGLYDHAKIKLYLVNWSNVSQRLLLRSGTIGEVTQSDGQFHGEMRGLSHQLQQAKGRTFQPACDALLGDQKCDIDLDLPAYKGLGVVQSIEPSNGLIVSGLDGFASDWFSRGKLIWQSGENEGRHHFIKRHSLVFQQDTSVTVSIVLDFLPYLPVQVGDEMLVTAGCDKAFKTCHQKFQNAVNFRGFPHMPGNDFLVAYPNKDDGTHDGGALAVDESE